MASPAVDFESALRSELHSRESGVTDSSPAPESQPETTQPDTATTDGITPPATPDAPAPDQAPEGITPQGQPAPVETQTSAREALAKRGYKIEDEKLAAEHLRIESELAAIRRAEKAKAKDAPAAEQVAATTPQPQAAQPVAATTAPEPPAQPVAPPSAGLADKVKEAVWADSECRALADEYLAVKADVQKIVALDRSGRVVGGRVAELDREIADLQRRLQPSETLKKHGIEYPELDALARQEVARLLHDLKLEKIEAIEEYRNKQSHMGALEQRFEGRRREYESHFTQQEQLSRAEADRKAEVAVLRTSFEQSWFSAVEPALKANSVPEDMRTDIELALKEAALARLSRDPNEYIQPAEIPAFMDSVVKREMAKSDKYHRSKSAEYAKAKEGDVKRVTPSPSGKAAVAAPQAKTETADFEERLRAENRARLRSRSVAV